MFCCLSEGAPTGLEECQNLYCLEDLRAYSIRARIKLLEFKSILLRQASTCVVKSVWGAEALPGCLGATARLLHLAGHRDAYKTLPCPTSSTKPYRQAMSTTNTKLKGVPKGYLGDRKA